MPGRLRWENNSKNTYWLLTLDGVRVGERFSHEPRQCCLCVDRSHAFWECDIAAAVRDVLQQQLARRGCHVLLQRKHFWLMHCQDRALHADLWRVACLAAVRAMERGRVTATLAKLPASPLPAYLALWFACIGVCSDLEDAIADYAALGKCRNSYTLSHPPPPPRPLRPTTMVDTRTTDANAAANPPPQAPGSLEEVASLDARHAPPGRRRAVSPSDLRPSS